MKINSRYITAALIIGLLASFILIIFSPSLPIWGPAHLPHESDKTLPLPSGQQIEQTFVWEHGTLDQAIFWLDTTRDIPPSGAIHLEIDAPHTKQLSSLDVRDIPPSGTMVFTFDPPLKAQPGDPGVLRLKLPPDTSRIWLKYQIDASIYDQGKLIYYPNQRKQGDLAWQLRYRRPALGSWPIQILFSFAILIAGTIVSFVLLKSTPPTNPISDKPNTPLHLKLLKQYPPPIILGLTITTFYAAILIRPGIWPGPTDFTKEISYVKASSEALKSFAWPLWSHYTCGGMGLLGNPEATTFSLSTLIALLLTPELALWTTIAIEAGLGAIGIYLLSRQLKLSPSASLVSTLITALSTTFAYKIVEGIVMLGGVVAFTPWILLFYLKGQDSKNHFWYLFSGFSLAAIFWRGDVHVVLGIIATLIIWTILSSLKKHSFLPFIPLIIIGAAAFLGSSFKILPYLEQPDLISEHVDPHSIQISADHLWDDIFLKLQPREFMVNVKHGKPEHFGYAGAYLGILPLVLAWLGIFTKHRYRWHLLVPLTLILLIAEGSLYEYFLRHAPPLDALLRMPTRFLLLSTLLLGLLAGIGTDKLLNIKLHNPSTKAGLIIIILFFISINLGLGTYTILHSYTFLRIDPPASSQDQPTLSPHRNFSPDQTQHASVLLAHNFLLPHVCGDQNNPPEFLSSIHNQTPIAPQPVTLTPNHINIQSGPGPQDIIIKTRFIPAWQTPSAHLLPNSDGAIHLVTSRNSPPFTNISYFSPTKTAQQLIAVMIFIITTYSILSLISKRRT